MIWSYQNLTCQFWRLFARVDGESILLTAVPTYGSTGMISILCLFCHIFWLDLPFLQIIIYQISAFATKSPSFLQFCCKEYIKCLFWLFVLFVIIIISLFLAIWFEKFLFPMFFKYLFRFFLNMCVPCYLLCLSTSLGNISRRSSEGSCD